MTTLQGSQHASKLPKRNQKNRPARSPEPLQHKGMGRCRPSKETAYMEAEMGDRTVCPLMSKSYSNAFCECVRESCAWWMGEACAVAYIGGNCKQNIRPWNQKGDK